MVIQNKESIVRLLYVKSRNVFDKPCEKGGAHSVSISRPSTQRKKILLPLVSNIPSLLTTRQNAKTTRLLFLQKEDLAQ